MKFWENTISEDNYDEEPELEIDEIITLFKLWINKNKSIIVNITNHTYSGSTLEELRLGKSIRKLEH